MTWIRAYIAWLHLSRCSTPTLGKRPTTLEKSLPRRPTGQAEIENLTRCVRFRCGGAALKNYTRLSRDGWMECNSSRHGRHYVRVQS